MGKLAPRMKNPMMGSPKLIPRIPEILGLATATKTPCPGNSGGAHHEYCPSGPYPPPPVPKELKKWVKMVQQPEFSTPDKMAGKLTSRMKNPMVGAPKLIPRIPEILSLALPKPCPLRKVHHE